MQKLLALILGVFLLAGCQLFMHSTPSNHQMNLNWKVVEIEKEIAKLQSSASLGHERYFILALLHSHPRNLRPDYLAAKNYLDRFLSFQPKDRVDWRPQYVFHLLESITSANDELKQIQKRLDTQIIDHSGCRKNHTTCGIKLKKAQEALKKTKKIAGRSQNQLNKIKKQSVDLEDKFKRLQSENTSLKQKLKDITELYINLEKKRQAIQ